jgi:GNAT superfamily N-acetyltransferase
MSALVEVVDVTDAAGAIVEAKVLASAESVHRQLRPQMPPGYASRMQEIFAGGARMAVARVGGKVAGVAVWRILEKTFTGRELYCDDLVTDEAQRSTGVGHALIAHMESVARAAKCDVFALDSGCQRQQAHKFYFREGMVIAAFRFSKNAK